MKVRLDRTRMAMEGENYAYDCLVPVSEVNRNEFNYFECIDGEDYISFVDATVPPEVKEMPRGEARYQAFRKHDRWANEVSWTILQSVFSELKGIGRCSLWVNIPGFEFPHETRFADVGLSESGLDSIRILEGVLESEGCKA